LADCQESPTTKDLPGPNSTPDDRRQAGALAVSLSSYVSTASLAVLAGAFAIFTYVSQNFQLDLSFYIPITLTALLLVASIFAGGKGSAWVIDRIANGEWTPKPRNRCYNNQALLTLFGLVFLMVATVFGVSSSPQESPDTARLDRRTWLEHLVASSDYRMAALEAKGEGASAEATKTTLDRHLSVQEGVHRRQCLKLAILFPATIGKAPCEPLGK
jgi:hypothetical protein